MTNTATYYRVIIILGSNLNCLQKSLTRVLFLGYYFALVTFSLKLTIISLQFQI